MQGINDADPAQRARMTIRAFFKVRENCNLESDHHRGLTPERLIIGV